MSNKHPRPVLHRRDHEHGGADTVRIVYESVGDGGGGDGGGGTPGLLGWLYATVPRGGSAIVSDGSGGYAASWSAATTTTSGDMSGVSLSGSTLTLPAGAFLCWYSAWANVTNGWPHFTWTFVDAHEVGYMLDTPAVAPVGLGVGGNVRFVLSTGGKTLTTVFQTPSGGDPTSDALVTMLVVRLAVT